MSANSKIEWTDSTANPIRARLRESGKVGWFCEKISPGCANCYASKMNTWRGNGYEFLPEFANRVELFLDEKTLESVLHWKKPRKIFWCDMTDMFQDAVKDEWLDRIFAVMAMTPQHTHQVLTKRPERMLAWFKRKPPFPKSVGETSVEERIQAMRGAIDGAPWKVPPWTGWPLPNVWLGVSVENQHFADERIPLLLQTPAAKRFISAEPLLGPVDLNCIGPLGATYSALGCIPCGLKQNATKQSGPHTCPENKPKLDWCIVGGESGPGARLLNVEWARDITFQCRAASVPVFIKQLGSAPRDPRLRMNWPLVDKKGGDPKEWPEELRIREFPQ